MIEEATITWLHLSDFHIKGDEGNINRQKIVIDSFYQDIKTQVIEHNLLFDYIFITGDLTFSGKEKEFDLFHEYIAELSKITGVPIDRIFVIPGNHDADRDKHNITWRCFYSCYLQCEDNIENLFLSCDDSVRVFDSMNNFINYLSINYTNLKIGLRNNIYYFFELEKFNRKISILGFNTAWMARGDEEERDILLGEYQVNDIISNIKNKDLVIGLMHHPFEWLKKFDENKIKNTLLSNCDFILNGHNHESDISLIEKPDFKTYIISSGSSYEKKSDFYAYNYVLFNLRTFKGHIFSRIKNKDSIWEYGYFNKTLDLSDRIYNKSYYVDYYRKYDFETLSKKIIKTDDYEGQLLNYIKNKINETSNVLSNLWSTMNIETKLYLLYKIITNLNIIDMHLNIFGKIEDLEKEDIKKAYLMYIITKIGDIS